MSFPGKESGGNLAPPDRTKFPPERERMVMKTTVIILCGKSNDMSLSDALLPALSGYGSVLYCGARRLARFGSDQPDFLVFDAERVPEINLQSGILLFKNSFEPTEPAFVPPGFSCVLESKNLHAAAALQGSGAAAVTCGTSPKDTVSIAALEEDTAALSLQRSITALDGSLLEPHDFAVSLRSGLGPHRILAVCAVLLISGIDSSGGYVI